MGEGGMSKGLPVGTNSFTVRALKALNVGLRLCLLTFPCERRGLLLPHTSALSLVKDKRGGTVVGVWVAVDAVVVLGAHGWVLVVEEAVGTVALGV